MQGGRFARRGVERQLRATVIELRTRRDALAVLLAQHEAMADEGEDAEVRSLVSDLVSARREADLATRHAALLAQAIERAEGEVLALERRRDELLARYEPPT